MGFGCHKNNLGGSRMSECICSSCKNLKSVISESMISENDTDKNGIAEEYVCEYGFPSEDCEVCEEDTCELTCDNFVSDVSEDSFVLSKCTKCGKELKLVPNNDEDGEVYCVTCYLND